MLLYLCTFPFTLGAWIGRHCYNVDTLKGDHYEVWSTNAWIYTMVHALSTFFFVEYTIPLQLAFQVYSMFAAYHIPRVNTMKTVAQLVCGVILTMIGLTHISTHTLFTFRGFQYNINNNVDKWRAIEFLYALFFMPTAFQRITSSILLGVSFLLT